MTEYKKLNDQAWLDFGKALLDEKGSGRQLEFLNACCGGSESFLAHVRDVYATATGDGCVDLDYKFSEREFIHPPLSTQEIIWEAYRGVPDEILTSCSFWGHATIRMLERGQIQPVFLASQINGETKTGAYILEAALKSGPEDKGKKVDDCVRRILRSMCNDAPRGKRIVFNDFHLGKAYWRWRWAEKMTESIGLAHDKILEILKADYYARFAEKMHTGKSYISVPKVFGGLLLFLQDFVVDKGGKIDNTKLTTIIDKFSFISAWKAIEMQAPEANREEIRAIADMTVA